MNEEQREMDLALGNALADLRDTRAQLGLAQAEIIAMRTKAQEMQDLVHDLLGLINKMAEDLRLKP